MSRKHLPLAAKRRKNAAHGASRGRKRGTSQPRRGERKRPADCPRVQARPLAKNARRAGHPLLVWDEGVGQPPTRKASAFPKRRGWPTFAGLRLLQNSMETARRWDKLCSSRVAASQEPGFARWGQMQPASRFSARRVDLIVPTFTRNRKGGPATLRNKCEERGTHRAGNAPARSEAWATRRCVFYAFLAFGPNK